MLSILYLSQITFHFFLNLKTQPEACNQKHEHFNTSDGEIGINQFGTSLLSQFFTTDWTLCSLY